MKAAWLQGSLAYLPLDLLQLLANAPQEILEILLLGVQLLQLTLDPGILALMVGKVPLA
jgi:hypothetical protein